MVRSPGVRMMVGKGFTLVEVMVALAVFAIVSVALVGNSMSTLRQAGIIQDRTLATWLAEDEITKLRMQPRSQENFHGLGPLGRHRKWVGSNGVLKPKSKSQKMKTFSA